MSTYEQDPELPKAPRCAKLAGKVRILHSMEVQLGVRKGEPVETGTYYDIACEERSCGVTERVFPDGPVSFSFVDADNANNSKTSSACVVSAESACSNLIAQVDVQIQNRTVELDAQTRR